MSRASELERNYDWMGSVGLYRVALGMVAERDVLKAAETHERIGYGFFRGATQADSVEEFRKRMGMSVESYERGAELFEKVMPVRGLYCRAMARYSDSWFVEDPSRKKELLDDCWRLIEEALEGFDAAGDQFGYGKAFHGLPLCLLDRYGLAEDWHESKRIVKEALKYAQKASQRLSQIEFENELAWTFTMVSFLVLDALDTGFFDEEKGELISVVSSYLEKALGISERIEDAYLQVFLRFALGWNVAMTEGDLQVVWKHAEKALEQAKKSKDHFLIREAYLALHWTADLTADMEEDPDKKKERRKMSIQFAEESIRHGLLVCRYRDVSLAYSTYLVDSYTKLAQAETNLQEKSAILKRSIEVGRKGSEYAQASGSQNAMNSIFHVISKAILFLSELEIDANEKEKLLEEALELREKTIQISDQVYPPYSWNPGVFQNYLALIKAELARMEKSEEKKRHLLEEAVSSMEKCLEMCMKSVSKGVALVYNFRVLGWYHDWFGEILDQLYSITKDEKVINRAIEVYRDAAQLYQRVGMPSRVAEAYWKAAKLYDRRGEYAKAADNFEQASKNYQLVAEKIPQFKCFYEDHKSYMQAWSEFEKAKLTHQKEQYEQSKTHYENSANLLKPTKRWRYLASNFAAWATLEQAEDLSKREKSEDARQAFQLAAQQFSEAKSSLDEEAKKIESPDEKANALELAKASERREEYCLARAELEEATMHGKKGDQAASAEKYDSVAERFKKIAEKLEDESDRNELLFQANLCRALEKMELAEEKADPDLYAEASELFTKTQKITTKKRNALLALGNSCFCKALESGTKFKVTPNADLYTTAKQYMEMAAHHYTEAGFETASKWTKATQRLFDAYVYMRNAESEIDPEKKVKHYQLAENHLDLAARLYETAGYLTKRDEILRHLERVREEKEILITPTEILKAPTIVSATPTISAPIPKREEAVGLEGFEHANIQANLFIRLKEVKVGEDINLEIELVNAGKRPALLVKTEQIIPEGFEIREKPEIYRVEDSYLNMKGKRLEPLKTEEVKLVLKALTKGTFTLKPRVLYLDETGKYRSHEPEPATIKVKELGISGWLKGPEKTK